MLKGWIGSTMRIDWYRIPVFLGTVWGLAFIFLMVDKNLSDPYFFEQSDYIMTFYVAGHLVASGQALSLYPTPDHSSFADSAFDRAAHLLLPNVPKQLTAVFMYNPLVAWIFVPLASMSPHISLLAWQMISIVSVAFSAWLLSRATKANATRIFFLSSLFLPVIATLWAGQVSLVIGLLPLSAGYFLFTRNHAFLAGFAWSVLSLKPQFVFLPGLVIFALALARRFQCGAGFVLGVVALIATNIIVVPMDVIRSWLHAIQLGESFFSSGEYQIREYLITSLPANILLMIPVGMRASVKWPVYAGAATLWLAGAWHCTTLVKSNPHEFPKIPLILVMAIILLPITSPYLLYYDLCIFLPAGVLLLRTEWPPSMSVSLKRIALIVWLSINAYMLAFTTVQAHLFLPLLLGLLLLGLFLRLLKINDSLRNVANALS